MTPRVKLIELFQEFPETWFTPGQIIREVHGLSYASVYSALRKLEQDGLIVSTSTGFQKYDLPKRKYKYVG